VAGKNLWAPWRIEYVQNSDKGKECFICAAGQAAGEDKQNFVLWRTARCVVLFNRFPYNNGHLLIAPVRHIGRLDEATDEELLEMSKLVRDSQKVLSLAIKPHGFNVGMNFGRCAGAGLPGHMHIHVVPRWQGDTNFMAVCADTDVISRALGELLSRLKQISNEHGFPSL